MVARAPTTEASARRWALGASASQRARALPEAMSWAHFRPGIFHPLEAAVAVKVRSGSDPGREAYGI